MVPIRDNVPARQPPVITWLIIGFNVFIFFHMVVLPSDQIAEIYHSWGVIPTRFLHALSSASYMTAMRNWFSILSSMFMHGGWFHLISNMWFLWLFGDNVEDRMGHVRYLIFYICSGTAAALLHVVLHSHSNVPTIGASGAIAGVMGAYFLFFPLARMIVLVPVLFYPLFFEVPAVLYFLLWLFSQVFNGTFSLLQRNEVTAGIAFWAHIGGFITGMIVAKIFFRNLRRRHRHYWEQAEYLPW